ncbi:hypothetical protein PIROE2DRAFT_1274 [Piromyces sp. E2]|nr:hypothetical protein PIROE2DRAFT_1274 [Piromyces sp. E2]|eukprot:OUM70419.1 hypothetical protein PIROE2DRAFT_1274 [Piromyces sp. E2]
MSIDYVLIFNSNINFKISFTSYFPISTSTSVSYIFIIISAGNNNSYSDLINTFTFSENNIKDYGKFIFYSKYGIQNTSKLANGKVNDVLYNTNRNDATVESIDEVSTSFTSNYDISMERRI